MSVAWKFVAVLALLFSLAALTLEIVRIQGEHSSDAVRNEVIAAMTAREQAFVERLASRVHSLRLDRELAPKSIKTFEDIGEAITEIIAVPPAAHSSGQPAIRP